MEVRRQLLPVLVGVLAVVGLPGCAAEKKVEPPAAAQKFDAPLRRELRQQERAENHQPISGLLEMEGPMDEERRQLLIDAGLRIGTVVSNIVTVAGPPDAYDQAASYPFVRSISLSHERRPLQSRD